MTHDNSAPDGGIPAIRARGLRRSFGSVLAVADATFDVPRGAIAALVGPNGAGKTTLLLLLAGLLARDAGDVTVAGFDPERDNRAARSRVGWMPDVFGTWDSLTAAETLTTVAAAYGMSKDASWQRCAELLDLMNLDEFAEQPAHVLSRGQKQRLGLARALVHDPQVLLLDEPAAGLDPRARIELRDVLRDLAADGVTIVVSSHVLSELDELADCAVFLAGGQVTSHGSMTKLRRQVTRTWRLAALSSPELASALDRRGQVWRPDPGQPGSVIVDLPDGADAAAALISELVSSGVALHTAAPAETALEAAYLAQDEAVRT